MTEMILKTGPEFDESRSDEPMKKIITVASLALFCAVIAYYYGWIQGSNSARSTQEDFPSPKKTVTTTENSYNKAQKSEPILPIAPKGSNDKTAPEKAPPLTFRPGNGDPATAKLKLREINGQAIDRRFSALYDMLALSVDQRLLLRNLKLDSIEQGASLYRKSAAKQGYADSDLTSAAVNDMMKSDFYTQVASNFGAPAAEVVKDYETTFPARQLILSVEATLSQSPTPLTELQVKSLVDVVIASARSPSGEFNLSNLDTNALLSAASPLLDPPQLQTLGDIHSRRKAATQSKK